eukprot:41387_1
MQKFKIDTRRGSKELTMANRYLTVYYMQKGYKIDPKQLEALKINNAAKTDALNQQIKAQIMALQRDHEDGITFIIKTTKEVVDKEMIGFVLTKDWNTMMRE